MIGHTAVGRLGLLTYRPVQPLVAKRARGAARDRVGHRVGVHGPQLDPWAPAQVEYRRQRPQANACVDAPRPVPVNANRLGLIGPLMPLAHRLIRQQGRSSGAHRVRQLTRRPEAAAERGFALRSELGLRMEVFQRIRTIGT